jgi:hypothetical protein
MGEHVADYINYLAEEDHEVGVCVCVRMVEGEEGFRLMCDMSVMCVCVCV